MTHTSTTSHYDRRDLSNGVTEFVVTPAPLPTASAGPSGFFLKLIPFVGTWLMGTIQREAYEKPMNKIRFPGGRFQVSQEGIRTADGSLVPKDRIHRLVIKNGVNDDPRNTGAYGRGTHEHARMANLNRAAQVSYVLVVEAGGQAHTLAGGMTETTAFGLVQDTKKVLGLAS